MKKFDRLMILTILLFIILVCSVNIYIIKSPAENTERSYKVSINRIKQVIERYEHTYHTAPGGLEVIEEYGNDAYTDIEKVVSIEFEKSTDEEKREFFNDNESYEIFMTDTNCYKIIYSQNMSHNQKFILLMNGVMMIAAFLTFAVLLFIRRKIISPFDTISELPYELAKGNLTVPVKAQKYNFFGRYLWGMDLLREKIEADKERELNLIKEKKLLLLSLSHDIKTPLSAIKLYSQALNKNLYKTEEKKKEVAGKIGAKVDEIENYVSEIVHASNEEFLAFDVGSEEFYIKEVIEKIRVYYKEKMALNRIEIFLRTLIQCPSHGSVEDGLKQRLSADLSVLPKAFFFYALK